MRSSPTIMPSSSAVAGAAASVWSSFTAVVLLTVLVRSILDKLGTLGMTVGPFLASVPWQGMTAVKSRTSFCADIPHGSESLVGLLENCQSLASGFLGMRG